MRNDAGSSNAEAHMSAGRDIRRLHPTEGLAAELQVAHHPVSWFSFFWRMHV